MVDGKMDRSNYQLGAGPIGSGYGQDDMVLAPLTGGGDQELPQGGVQQRPGLIQGFTGRPPGREKSLATAANLAQVYGIPEPGISDPGVECLMQPGEPISISPGQAHMILSGALAELVELAAGEGDGSGTEKVYLASCKGGQSPVQSWKRVQKATRS